MAKEHPLGWNVSNILMLRDVFAEYLAESWKILTPAPSGATKRKKAA
jgi:uncharacterized protein YbdZ (MbtH family)